MHRAQEQVRQFHRDVLGGPVSPAEPRLRNPVLRARLILEEAIEVAFALVGAQSAQSLVQERLLHVVRSATASKTEEPDLTRAIGELCDLAFVTYGSAEDVGVDLEPFFDEVTRANLDKRDPGCGQKDTQEPLGKAIKPKDWVGPDIAGVLKKMLEERAAPRRHQPHERDGSCVRCGKRLDDETSETQTGCV